jgi:hypothetical protein
LSTHQAHVEPQAIEELQKRHRDLERRKVQAETELASLERQLDEARGEVRRQFGTDDLDELRALLARMKDENLKRRADYQAHLDALEGDLVAVEQAHASARTG